MGNCLHQVRLAEARRTVDEERIVGLSWGLGDRVRERLGLRLIWCAGQSLGLRQRCHEEVHLGAFLAIFLDPENDCRRSAQDGLGKFREKLGVFGFVPFDRELIRRPYDETPLIEGDRLGGLEPRSDGVIWKLSMGGLEDSLPCFLRS